MQPEILANAPRCGARTRIGGSCRAPAVNGRSRCHMHGGTNIGAPKGNKHARVHGNRSREAEEQLKLIVATNRDLRLVKKLNSGRKFTAKERERMFELYLERMRNP